MTIVKVDRAEHFRCNDLRRWKVGTDEWNGRICD